MAKNKNQNRQRENQRDEQRGSAGEAREQGRGTLSEERVMPSATQAPRGKHQKRFGHN